MKVSLGSCSRCSNSNSSDSYGRNHRANSANICRYINSQRREKISGDHSESEEATEAQIGVLELNQYCKMMVWIVLVGRYHVMYGSLQWMVSRAVVVSQVMSVVSRYRFGIVKCVDVVGWFTWIYTNVLFTLWSNLILI